jgi:50S ribosomal subunit-associated GTPase HflX
MKKCMIIGKTNVGKTLFLINFAAFLGMRKICLNVKNQEGNVSVEYHSIPEALKVLVNCQPHHTTSLQGIKLRLPAGKVVKNFELIDSTGLMEGIPKDINTRRKMAQTLSAVREADLILHMIDASAAGQKGALEAFGEVDYQVAQFSQMKGNYLLLANKMDLPGAKEGLEIIRKEFVGHPIIPISSLTQEGFAEVKRIVWKWI